jgi:hypothetical protein
MESQLINAIISTGSTEDPRAGYSGFLKERGIDYSYQVYLPKLI